MKYLKFSDYYTESLVKDPKNDYLFEKIDSDKWLFDHSAITSRGSLIISFADNVSPEYFSDFYVIPEIIESIKKYTDKDIMFLTNESDNEKYVYKRIRAKFPDKEFPIKKMSDNFIKDIRMLELENKNVIAILKSQDIFSIKHLIEYI